MAAADLRYPDLITRTGFERAMLATLRAANSLLDRLLAGERLPVAIGAAEDAAWSAYAAAEASGALPRFGTPR